MHSSNRTTQTFIALLFAMLTVGLALLTVPVPAAARPPLGISMDDGTVSAPAFNFSSDTDTGLYRIGANNIGIATNGAKIFDCTASGCANAGTFTTGGGYGSTGCSISASGVLQCDGEATFAGGAVVNTGLTISSGTTTFGGAVTITDTLNMSNAAITNIGNSGTDFASNGGLTLANALTVSAGGANVTGGLSMAGVSFTGPLKYAAAASYASGTAITHGFAVTPTVCGLLGATSPITDAVTSLGSSTTFSITFSAGTTPTVYWMCGQ